MFVFKVTGVVGRADVLACMLFLLAFLSYIRYGPPKWKKEPKGEKTQLKALVYHFTNMWWCNIVFCLFWHLLNYWGFYRRESRSVSSVKNGWGMLWFSIILQTNLLSFSNESWVCDSYMLNVMVLKPKITSWIYVLCNSITCCLFTFKTTDKPITTKCVTDDLVKRQGQNCRL